MWKNIFFCEFKIIDVKYAKCCKQYTHKYIYVILFIKVINI